MPAPKRRAPRRTPRRSLLAERELSVPGLDPRHDGLRVAQLTDVHCGWMTPAAHVRAAVEAANAAKPHLIAMTGDYVCWRRSEIPIMERQLAGLSAAPVVVALGNHDYFAGGDHVADAMSANGYTVLRNRHLSLSVRGAPLHVVGLDDPVTRRHDVDQAFAAVPEEGTRLALSHCPEQLDELSQRRAHVVLSGHTHGGQVFVRGVTDRIFQKTGRRYFRSGVYRSGNTVMYLSAGVGYSGVRLRAGKGTRAEVALLVLRAER